VLYSWKHSKNAQNYSKYYVDNKGNHSPFWSLASVSQGIPNSNKKNRHSERGRRDRIVNPASNQKKKISGNPFHEMEMDPLRVVELEPFFIG